MASWTEPIALIPTSSMNTINSVCSVASYYGVSLEVLRSSELSQVESGDSAKIHSNENVELKQLVQGQLFDYTHQANS